ncbi:MAG: GMC family oxidoreductase N-terminal domain-containing protein [Deltaproteobacteria bacterium]|nr:GMC family oxidoreductase N-terminal domain-containing protein [Deltaproteobacteria bacterium]
MSFSVGRPPISIPLGRLVGGTTAINSGTCFRVPDGVLAEWQREHGFPADFAPEALAPYLDRVAAELQVAPNEPRHLGQIAVAVARGADAMGLDHGPLPRNAPGCDAQGVCTFGCPTGAKRSTDVSYVPRALEAGASLFTGLPVTRLLRRGRRVVAVEARGADRYGVPKVLRIHADAVVISCGSIYSPMMLWQNGYRNRWIGRNLSVHPGLGMLAMFDEPMEPWNAVPQGYGVHGYEDPDIKLEGFWVPPQLLGGMLSLSPPELTRWMDAQDRVGQYGFMVRDRNVGTVMRSADGTPIIRYSLTDDLVARMQKASAVLAELLLRGGAREVATGFRRMETVTTVAQARDIERLSLNAMDFNLLGSHPLGTCRMGPHPEKAVVDFDHRVYGTDNLFVVDGSSVPTSLGVNPQMTIMALATRAAERLAQRF